jgi:carboxyl-terminal processing protease
MNKPKYLLISLSVAMLALSVAFKEDLFQISKNLDIFASLYKEVSINYVEETEPSTLMKTGIDAMLDSLDPYTEYIPEAEIEDYKLKYQSTQYGGIGASTVLIDDKLFINEVTEGNPADKGGLSAGDQIVTINGVNVASKERQQISQLLRGPKGTEVALVLRREGTVINKTLVRQEIKQPNVSFSGQVGDGIGYIKLDKFLENAAQEVKSALDLINKENPKGVILDLRHNGGGILQEAVKIVNLFVDKGQLVVVQKGRNPEKTFTYKTMGTAVAPNVPLIVLIDNSSASASEIVAGALQDLDRAIILGQRSFGKGLVQQTISLPYNSLIKVTVAKYYTPSGRCIQALDYAHKNKDGKAEKFADSLMTAFETKAGRKVYNGNGVFPDVVTGGVKLSPISISLANKNWFFDYANSYKKTHKTIAEASKFQLSDQEYDAFVASLANKDYKYTSKTETLLNELKAEAEKENKLSAVKTELEQLKLKMLSAKQTELIAYKSEIKKLLETHIVSRYYYGKGRVLQAFQYDKELAKAKSIFANQPQMLAILKGDGEYKTIGSPVKTSVATD